jgi:hypothetical protein
MFNNKDKKVEVICPWCNEKQLVKSIPDNMIMAFNCKHCTEPIVLIHNRPLKIDKKTLETGDILKLQEHIMELMKEEFDIAATIENVDPSKEDVLMSNDSENDEKPVSEKEIRVMKNFLDDYKIPRDGDMFKE